jgi:cytochrome P450
MISLTDPEDIKIVFNSDNCIDKPSFVYNALTGYGLVAHNGDVYKTHRKAINPLFTPKALQNYIPEINRQVVKFLKNFDANLTDKIFDVSEETLLYTFQLSLKVFFGIEDMERKTCLNFIDNTEK